QLPPDLTALGVRTTDSYNRPLFYDRVAAFTANNLCTNPGAYLTVNDNSSGTPSTKTNVAFIILADGENRTNNTGAASPYTIQVQSDTYDDIVMYVDIDTLRKQTCTSFNIVTDSLPTGSEEGAYPATQLEATDGTTPYTWALASGALPPGLILAAAGTISGTPTLDGSYNFTVRVTDSDTPNRIATRSLTITINPNKPHITTEFLNYGQAGQSYGATLSATGGLAPYLWNIPGGLPAGLSLQTAGTCTAGATALNCSASNPCICGTPAAAGTFTFTPTVTDARARTSTKTLSLAINALPSAGAPACSLTANPDSIISGSTTLTWAINNGPATGAWSSPPGGTCPSPVPSGSGGSCTTGPIAATTTFNLTVTSSQGSSNCSATVYVGPPTTIVPSCTLEANPNMVPSGSPTTLIWSISNGPATATFAPASGTCIAFPNSFGGNCTTAAIGANTTFTLTASNANGSGLCATTVYPQTGGVCPAMSITTGSLPNGVRNLNYSAILSVSGGLSPFTWTWAGNPATLTLNASTGQITGVPTLASVSPAYNVAVTLTDSCSSPQTVNRNFTFAVGYNANYVVRNNRGSTYYIRGGQYAACTTRNNNQDFNVGYADATPVNVYSTAGCSNLQLTIYYSNAVAADTPLVNGLLRINAAWNLIDR
ncbi:MAG: putative Ig domain-containing protein, partial [Nitrospirae bacterium]|nr:putative Ig domain-containing protein [Nitrospirota bacterium]